MLKEKAAWGQIKMLLETGFVIGGAVGAGVHCTLIYTTISLMMHIRTTRTNYILLFQSTCPSEVIKKWQRQLIDQLERKKRKEDTVQTGRYRSTASLALQKN